MLKYLWNYCPSSHPRIRPQKIDWSANNIPVITNRLYIDTYLFVINIEYLSQRLIFDQMLGASLGRVNTPTKVMFVIFLYRVEQDVIKWSPIYHDIGEHAISDYGCRISNKKPKETHQCALLFLCMNWTPWSHQWQRFVYYFMNLPQRSVGKGDRFPNCIKAGLVITVK
jgi:hypothetical protein